MCCRCRLVQWPKSNGRNAVNKERRDACDDPGSVKGDQEPPSLTLWTPAKGSRAKTPCTTIADGERSGAIRGDGEKRKNKKSSTGFGDEVNSHLRESRPVIGGTRGGQRHIYFLFTNYEMDFSTLSQHVCYIAVLLIVTAGRVVSIIVESCQISYQPLKLLKEPFPCTWLFQSQLFDLRRCFQVFGHARSIFSAIQHYGVSQAHHQCV